MADSLFSNVVLLLHMEGANGGSTFTDSCAVPNTVSLNGNATTANTVVKFGTTAAKFTGSTSKLYIPHSAALNPTGDFCIECWIYIPTGNTNHRMIFIKSMSSGSTPFAMWVDTSRKLNARSSNTVPATIAQLVSTTSVPTDTWTHVAYDRSGSTFRLFMSGVQEATTTAAGTLYTNAADYVVIGNTYDNLYPIASTTTSYIDDARISNVSRYTANFTPPTVQFEEGYIETTGTFFFD